MFRLNLLGCLADYFQATDNCIDTFQVPGKFIMSRVSDELFSPVHCIYNRHDRMSQRTMKIGAVVGRSGL
jgi:hypothetical protein